MPKLRILAALIVTVGMTTGAYGADPDTDKPIQRTEDVAQGATPVDPGGLLMLSTVEGGTTTPLVINPQGTALMRGAAGDTPTTLGIVEGSRVAIPRAADGSCPDVDVALSDTLDAEMAIFYDPDNPRKFLAADVRSEMEHKIDPLACEVVISRARGYVSYHKKVVKKKLSGKVRRELAADFTEPVYPDVPLPTPTPGGADRAATAPPPNAPNRQPAFRATTLGTIEPISAADGPRSMRQVVWNQCIVYEFESWARRSLYRYYQGLPQLYGWYAYNRARMKYVDYPWRSILNYTYRGFTQSGYKNYYISHQSHTTTENLGQKYAPWLHYSNVTLVTRQGGPGFSSDTHVWAAPWDSHNEWSSGRVPSYPWGPYQYRWTWLSNRRHTIAAAYNVCD